MASRTNHSVDRALSLLRLLAGAHRPRFADIQAQSGIPKGTLHSLLARLEAAEFTRRSVQGYEIGLAAFEVGIAVRVPASLRAAVAPLLDEQSSLGEACHSGRWTAATSSTWTGATILTTRRITRWQADQGAAVSRGGVLERRPGQFRLAPPQQVTKFSKGRAVAAIKLLAAIPGGHSGHRSRQAGIGSQQIPDAGLQRLPGRLCDEPRRQIHPRPPSLLPANPADRTDHDQPQSCRIRREFTAPRRRSGRCRPRSLWPVLGLAVPCGPRAVPRTRHCLVSWLHGSSNPGRCLPRWSR
jgi:IclR helix-turn-helix domain